MSDSRLPRIRQLVALHLGKSEDEIQAMKEVKIRLIWSN